MWWYRKALLRAVIGIVVLALAAGCGYRFRDQVSVLPQTVHSVAVPVFENRTTEAGLENVITAALITEFNRRQKLAVKNADRADAVLRGVISAIHYSPVSFGADERATERRVRLNVDVWVVETSSGRTLWTRQGLTYLEAYAVRTTDPVITEFNKRRALAKLSQNLAEKVHDYLFSDF